MSEGRVKWFNDKKGYGFIETDDQGDVFVHYTGIAAEGFRTLNEGDRVTFDVQRGPKGPQAIRVVRLEKPDLSDSPLRNGKFLRP